MRAPYNVLVLPYRRTPEGWEFALLLEADEGNWQGIAGGGEDDETPEQAARREAREEGDLPDTCPLTRLQALQMVPVCYFDAPHWSPDLYTIPQYAFGLDATGCELQLSSEHREVAWMRIDQALERAFYDSDRVALWELNLRLTQADPRKAARLPRR
ncbi:MAG: NUDIX domain-containing protein [Chloroflexi bacterium]|mgnify:CR=1 FL=1|nr:NUDIX domain-containing protein [Chloroflexota bacterium]